MFVSENSNIVQANFLVENRPSLTKDETRLFLTIVASVNKDTEDFKPIQIPVAEFADLWGIDPKNAYEQVKTALRGLRNREFFYEGINPKTGKMRFITTSSISSAVYEEGEGYATVEISSFFKPYLLDLQSRYTSYVLKNIMDLSTVQAIRNYELLKQYLAAGNRTLTLEDYRKKLSIEKKYPDNTDLKRYVIEPCIAEINEKTDIFVTFEITGRGKRAKVIFKIREKNVEAKQKQPDVIPGQITFAEEEVPACDRNAEQNAFYRSALADEGKSFSDAQIELLRKDLLLTDYATFLNELDAHRRDMCLHNYLQAQDRYVRAQNYENYFSYLRDSVKFNYANFIY